ncbi:MAG: filamentous hemagglutinin N-terminal domain-containing protein, partial [Actinobacteria bacterium]|nr:filamentous hemagglutinin N-terminal domain-containing protein [Actinomycetota bacterium]
TDPLGQPATYLITPELGEQRGSNLFHSFESFGIGSGETATFMGPDPIDGPQSVSNLISRVTGETRSDIDGTLRSTIPGADLWLLNPSGVVFGEDAELDVKGSFHASTGDYVGFGEGGLERFQADPARPSVLSTAPPAAFGFLGEDGAAALTVDADDFEVTRGELTLVGADVSLAGADVMAPGGHVSLEAHGAVELSDSLVDVGGETPGSVSIRSGRLVLEQGSEVLAENLGATEDAGGAITVDASESVLVDDSLLSVDTSSAGDAGTIHVTSPEVVFRNGPGAVHDFGDPTDSRNQPHPVEVGASAVTSGSGAGGRIEIDGGSLRILSGVSVTAGTIGLGELIATGNAGTIHIDADSMEVLDRSNVFAGVFGRSEGNAGTVQIDVRGHLRVDGSALEDGTREEGAVDFAFIDTSVYFSVGENLSRVPGALGTVDIRAGSVEFVNAARIGSECGGCTSKAHARREDAATVRIKADSILVGQGGIVSVGTFEAGDGGVIEIHGDSLELREGGGLFAGTTGEGDAGRIEIGTLELPVESVAIESLGSIDATTSAAGHGGSVSVNAESVVVSTGGSINASTSGPGNGGTLEIATGSLELREGGSIIASTSGPSHGGDVSVDAMSVVVGTGGFINASSTGTGDAGTIDVIASESVRLDHEEGPRFSLLGVLRNVLFGAPVVITGIFSATVHVFSPGGEGGSITLEAPEITVTNGAIVATSTVGGGDAGDLLLSGDRIHILNGALVDSTSVPFGGPLAAAGSVTLEARELIEVVGRHPEFGDVSRVASATLG